MTKYKIVISYDGSKYCGLQKLKNAKTVQGELEVVLSKMNEAPVKVVSSGRTDKGVHAIMQVCSFELEKTTTPFRLRYYIDRSTSPYLHVSSCEEIEDVDFHARFSVKSKTYKYIINEGSYDAIYNDYIYNYNKTLDIASMKKASQIFLGPHNFRAFVVGPHKSCDSIIDDIYIMKENGHIVVKIRAKAFYTYMARNIVASLILIGEHTITEEDLKYMLETGKKSIEFAPVPPNGLYLELVEY